MLALACFSLVTWKPACFETGRCCPVRLCGLVACCARCVHKGQRGKSYAERGGTNDLSSHTAVVTHGSSNGDVDGLMLFSRHLHQHVDVRRGAEIGCKPNRLPGASAPQKRRTKIRQASEPVRQRRLTHPGCSGARSCVRLGICTSVTDQRATRFMADESFACRRRALSRPSRTR